MGGTYTQPGVARTTRDPFGATTTYTPPQKAHVPAPAARFDVVRVPAESWATLPTKLRPRPLARISTPFFVTLGVGRDRDPRAVKPPATESSKPRSRATAWTVDRFWLGGARAA